MKLDNDDQIVSSKVVVTVVRLKSRIYATNIINHICDNMPLKEILKVLHHAIHSSLNVSMTNCVNCHVSDLGKFIIR